jgi:pimeloyl-ACP methyl ester carboxylesterase
MKFALFVFLAFDVAFSPVLAGDLPRKVQTPRETYPNVDVIYDSVATPHGERLRTIVTKPRELQGKLPVVFVAGWLSCDSVEAPENTRDETGMLFRQLAQLPGLCLFRVDKQGVGDSEGNCADNDFNSELAGYRAAFRALKNYDFIDTGRVYLLGISNGGGFAPLVPETSADQGQVRGFIVIGGWVKTWFEHMLEIERRRFGLMGQRPGEVTERMKKTVVLYYEWLVKKRRVADILGENSAVADLWPEGKDREHLYGRPLGFYEQLQSLNLAEAWSKVKVPTLVLHGQYDWIMSREDHQLIAQYVNANSPGAARFVEVADMGHTLQTYANWSDAFAGKSSGLNKNGASLIVDWLKDQLKR